MTRMGDQPPPRYVSTGRRISGTVTKLQQTRPGQARPDQAVRRSDAVCIMLPVLLLLIIRCKSQQNLIQCVESLLFLTRKMKSENKKTNASRQARSQFHLSEGVATKREQFVTDLTQLQIVPESSFSATHITVWLLTTLAGKRPWLIL
jgi:hypothetical protein